MKITAKYNKKIILATVFGLTLLAVCISQTFTVKSANGKPTDGRQQTVSKTNSAPGSLDPTFSGDGKSSGFFSGYSYDRTSDLARQTDGKIIMVDGSEKGDRSQCMVIRFNANGTLDNTFGTAGMKVLRISSSEVQYGCADVVVQPDGKIVIVGSKSDPDDQFSVSDVIVYRLNADGSPDTSFGGTGEVTFSVSNRAENVTSVALQTDGKIVVAGYTDTGGFNYDVAVVRYNADGTLDTTFDSDGKAIFPILSEDDVANSVVLQNDGKIVLAGYAANGKRRDFALARLNSDGSLDTSFGSNGKVTTQIGDDFDIAESVKIQSDGKIIAAGNSYSESGVDFALVRYHPNGSLDTTYGADGKIVFDWEPDCSDYLTAIAIDSSDRTIAVGETEGISAIARFLGGSTQTAGRTPFDFDGRADVGVFRPSNSTWYVQRSTAGILIQKFGSAGDLPVQNTFVP